VRGGVEQRSQDARSRELELTPKLPLHPSPTVGDGWQCPAKGAIGEVGPADDIVNAIEKNRARRLKQHLVCVRVELSQPEARAPGQPAKGVRQRMGQARQIVERKDMRIVGGDHEVAFLALECPHRRHVRVDQSLE
jgi:hypothetical protein